MRIDNLTFSLFIPKLTGIRQKIDEFERGLGKYFTTPFTILPIPEDAPAEIPRIIAKSPNGHSELLISLINIQLTINFDEKFSQNFDQCFEYIEEKINILIDLFSKYSEGKFVFSGISCKVIKDCYDNPIEFLQQKFIKIKNNKQSPYDISQKIAYLLQNKYFLNFNISNIRIFHGSIDNNMLKPKISEVFHNIAIEIDVNDKYGYNHNSEYICDKDSIKTIINIIRSNINNNVRKLLEEGELDL